MCQALRSKLGHRDRQDGSDSYTNGIYRQTGQPRVLWDLIRATPRLALGGNQERVLRANDM